MKKLLLFLGYAITLLPLYVHAQCSVVAGNGLSVCANIASFPIQGTATGYTTHIWTTSGTGSISAPANLGIVYTPSAADLTAGKVVLTLAGSNGPSCANSSDTIMVIFRKAPVFFNPETSRTQCFGYSYMKAAYGTTATGVTWTSSGSGTFSPNNKKDTVSYNPGLGDEGNTITFTATTNSDGLCAVATQTFTITYTPAARVEVGPDVTGCMRNPVMLAGAIVTNATGVNWTTNGSGIFTPSSTALNPTYIPSGADSAKGNVVVTARTTGNGSCPLARDSVYITILKVGPYVNAGKDGIICGNVGTVKASFGGTSNLVWTSSGSGTFSAFKLSDSTSQYTVSQADRDAGSVTLTATTTPNGVCPVVSDQVVYVVQSSGQPLSNAGPDQTICGNSVSLHGSVANAKGGTWSSNGTGTFTPGINYLNATYTLSPGDITKGTVSLVLNTSGTCIGIATDTMKVTVSGSSAATANAGPDQIVLSGNVTLSGTSGGSTGIIWTSTGTGTFNNSLSLNTIYTPSAADIANGLIELILSTTGNGSCAAAQDRMFVTLGTTHDISGTVKGGVASLDNGTAYLFKTNGSVLSFITSSAITAGNYLFENLPSGTYILMASPTAPSALLDTYLPTYSGNVTDWKNAQTVVISSADASTNITLMPYVSADASWDTGDDVIAGTVYITNPAARLIDGSDVPAPYVTVYLLNSSGNTIAYTQTKADGSYAFNNVKAGVFKVQPQFGGLVLAGTATSVAVATDGNAATVEDGNIAVQRQNLSTGILSNVKATTLVSYPNPATSSVSVNLMASSSTGTAKLMFETGTVVLHQEVDFSKGSLTLQIESLPAGLYILQIVGGDEVYTSKVVKY